MGKGEPMRRIFLVIGIASGNEVSKTWVAYTTVDHSDAQKLCDFLNQKIKDLQLDFWDFCGKFAKLAAMYKYDKEFTLGDVSSGYIVSTCQEIDKKELAKLMETKDETNN